MPARRPELRARPEDRGERRAPRQAKRPKRRLNRFVKWGLLGGLWLAIVGFFVLGYFALSLPSTSDLTVAERRPSVTILAADGSLIATFGDLFGEPLRLSDMPRYLPLAVIATEDRRFYHHFGIDPFGLARAAWANLRAHHVVQGGSTITQQLAKNLFLTNERTFTRKIQEVMLALWLEHKFTKDQILEIYLNRVYLGAGTYGVDAAAHRYFGKSARSVSLYEAAVIAGLLKAPTRFSPAHDSALAGDRAEQVLSNMIAAGFLNPAQAAAAAKERKELAHTQKTPQGSRYFADWVAEQIGRLNEAQGRDVVVTTTLNARLQAAAEAAIDSTLERDGDKNDVEEGALVAMTPDGAVRAMVGGRDYADSQFNRATQALRQPGSAFKPMVYLAALEQGLRPTDHFVDKPIRIGKWEPHNFEGRYRGEMSVAEALADSVNTVAVQVLARTGVDNVINTAHRLGITSNLPRDASLALGTGEVSLLDLTSAYAAFASDGIAAWPYGILEVRDAHGGVVFHRSGSGAGRVIDPAIAGTMNEMLMGVLAHGTGKAAQLDRPAAGKTGTTQDSRDAFFVGYTADLVAGVWFGNDDNSPMRGVTGGTLPARTWKTFMLAATRDMPVLPLPLGRAGREVAAAPAGGGIFDGLNRLLRSIFSGGSGVAPPERQSP